MKVIGRCKKCHKIIGIDGYGYEYQLEHDRWGIPYWTAHKCKQEVSGE